MTTWYSSDSIKFEKLSYILDITFLRRILHEMFIGDVYTGSQEIPLFELLSSPQKFHQVRVLMKGLIHKDTPLPEPTYLNLSTYFSIFDHLGGKIESEIDLHYDDPIPDTAEKEEIDVESILTVRRMWGDLKPDPPKETNREKKKRLKKQRKRSKHSDSHKRMQVINNLVRKEKNQINQIRDKIVGVETSEIFQSLKKPPDEQQNYNDMVRTIESFGKILMKKYDKPKNDYCLSYRELLQSLCCLLLPELRLLFERNETLQYCTDSLFWRQLIGFLIPKFVTFEPHLYHLLWGPINLKKKGDRRRNEFIYSLANFHILEYERTWTYEKTVRNDLELLALCEDHTFTYPMNPPHMYDLREYNIFNRGVRGSAPSYVEKVKKLQRFMIRWYNLTEEIKKQKPPINREIIKQTNPHHFCGNEEKDEFKLNQMCEWFEIQIWIDCRIQAANELPIEEIYLRDLDYNRRTHPRENRTWVFLFECGYCGRKETRDKRYKKCGKCKVERYCQKKCQKKDWKEHKTECEDLKKRLENREVF